MTRTSIEITDTQYLIRLNKDELGYDRLRHFVAQLLTEQADPRYLDDWEHGQGGGGDTDCGDRFDRLSDK